MMVACPVSAAATFAPPAILTATTYPPIGSIVILGPLPNFTATAPGPTNGALTAAELGALSSDPQKAEAQFNVLAQEAGFGAYLRLWTDTNGPGKGANDIVITLYRIPNSQDAASFASGSQQPYQQPGAASSFSVPSIPGAHGYTVSISSPSQVTEQVVLFKSGPYVAIVQLASSVASSNPAPLNPSDAITVSFQQYNAIRHSLRNQTAGARSSGTASAPSKHGSAVPTVLAVIGGLVVLAAIAWITAGPPRNRRRRRRVAVFTAPRELAVPVPIDVPAAETRPVRLARGPVIRVVEVEPRTGSVASEPKATPFPVVTHPPVPAWSAARPATQPEPPRATGAETRSVFEPVVEPGPGAVLDIEPDPEPWIDVRPAVEPGPTIGPAFASTAEPDLEELELAESAAAELAAVELSKLGTLVEPVSLGEAGTVPDRVVDPQPAPVIEPGNHRPAPAPRRAHPGSGQTPVGRFDDPLPGTPPGWLPDPSGLPDVLRYWDGHAWTFHVATRAVKH